MSRFGKKKPNANNKAPRFARRLKKRVTVIVARRALLLIKAPTKKRAITKTFKGGGPLLLSDLAI